MLRDRQTDRQTKVKTYLFDRGKSSYIDRPQKVTFLCICHKLVFFLLRAHIKGHHNCLLSKTTDATNVITAMSVLLFHIKIRMSPTYVHIMSLMIDYTVLVYAILVV